MVHDTARLTWPAANCYSVTIAAITEIRSEMTAGRESSETARLLTKPTNHMEVQGELCKLFYHQFGDEALPIIEAVFGAWGQHLGAAMRSKMSGSGLKAAAEIFSRSAANREPAPEMIELSDDRMEMKVFSCPYRLNGVGRPLCDAMTAMDRAMFVAVVGGEIEAEYIQVLAAGDECCHLVIRPK